MKKLFVLAMTAVLAVSCMGAAPASSEKTTVSRFLAADARAYDSYGDRFGDDGSDFPDAESCGAGGCDCDSASGPLDFVLDLIDRIFFDGYDVRGGYDSDDDDYYDDDYYDDYYGGELLRRRLLC
jgi:hypothetical protein